MAAVAVFTGMLVLLGATVWLYERRLEREQRASLMLLDRLQADLERSRVENVQLLRQVAGIDPTPEQQRADMLEQLGIGPPLNRVVTPETIRQPGPLQAVPSRWEQPPDDYYEDPTDLTAPLDQLPDGWTGIDAPQLAWNPDTPLPAPEPVPEGEYRERIVGMGLDENPLEELGIEPIWRTE